MSADPARSRFFTLQAVRIAGVVQVVLAALILGEKLQWPAIAGYVLLANGLVDAFLIPGILSKKWRSPS